MIDRVISGVSHIAATIGPFILAACLGGAVVFFLACGKSRSPLVKDSTVPRTCKYILEGLYYDQKDKSGYATFGEACKATEAYEYCKSDVKDIKDERDKDRLFTLCLAKHGK